MPECHHEQVQVQRKLGSDAVQATPSSCLSEVCRCTTMQTAGAFSPAGTKTNDRLKRSFGRGGGGDSVHQGCIGRGRGKGKKELFAYV